MESEHLQHFIKRLRHASASTHWGGSLSRKCEAWGRFWVLLVFLNSWRIFIIKTWLGSTFISGSSLVGKKTWLDAFSLRLRNYSLYASCRWTSILWHTLRWFLARNHVKTLKAREFRAVFQMQFVRMWLKDTLHKNRVWLMLERCKVYRAMTLMLRICLFFWGGPSIYMFLCLCLCFFVRLCVYSVLSILQLWKMPGNIYIYTPFLSLSLSVSLSCAMHSTRKWMVGIRSFPFGARPIFRGYVSLGRADNIWEMHGDCDFWWSNTTSEKFFVSNCDLVGILGSLLEG